MGLFISNNVIGFRLIILRLLMLQQPNYLYRVFERSFLLEWLFAFAVVVVARLPYLLSAHVYFDGDEAMLGIMARDLLNGTNIPFYFYGQNYGLSFFEVLSAAVFIPFLGSSLASLKLGGMLLFSLGIQRFLRVFRKLEFSQIAFLLAVIILGLFPTWLVWATKLRGGYITAFVGLAFILEQVLLYPKWEQKNWVVVVIIGSIIIWAQPLFLLPIIPILVKRLFSIKKTDILPLIAIGLVSLILLRLPAYLNSDYWTPTGVGVFEFQNFSTYLIDGFWSNFTGWFSYRDLYEVPELVKWSALSLSVCIVALFAFALSKSKREQKTNLLLLAIGIVLSAIPVAFFGVSGGRYLLPFYTGIMLLLTTTLVYLHTVSFNQLTKSIGLLTLVLVMLPGVSGYSNYTGFWLEPKLNDMQVLNELRAELKSRDIEHAFVSEWQLAWQLNYLGNDESSFRYLFETDRVQCYIDDVNACYLNSECKIAMVGTHWPLHDMQNLPDWNTRMERVNDRFYIMNEPEVIFLETGGFELPTASLKSN